MFKLNTGIRITFVVERMDPDQLKKYFAKNEFFISAALNELELIKIKKASEDELSDLA